MRLKKAFAILFVLLCSVQLLWAQNYPIQLSTQLVPPFSGYMADYANGGEEKLKIICLLTDFTKPHYNIKIKISIQGQGIHIQSKPYFYEGPFTLEPGLPFEISGSQLYNLLNSQNLDFSGISKAQYEQKKVLPEGYYTVCVTAYDFNNPLPIQVSNNACAQAWMILSDPPFLNLPACGSVSPILTPQQLSFSFTQMNMGSPNSAANTDYVFELWEIRPQGAVPNNIVQTVPPIYTYTTNQTIVNYGLTEPPLLPGMQYAWRVRAVDITGRDYFKNNGYSQVCTFTYGSALDGANINLNIHAQTVSQRQVKVWWDSLTNFSSYTMQFRKVGGNGNWFPVSTANCHVRVLDLEPQTTYEFRVQGVSSEYTSEYTTPVNATTQPLPNYQCGELPGTPVNGSFTPLQQAHINMIWQVGQFELRVTQLQNMSSATGIYSGYGKIRMPFINDVLCSFNNIAVSNEQVVVQGKVIAVSQKIDDWINSNSIGNVQNGTAEPEIHTSTPLTPSDIHIDANNGTATIGGTTYTYTPNGTTVEDSNGNLFIITADGQVISAGTAGNGHGPVPDYKNFIVTDKGKVSFDVSAKQLYGTDKFSHNELTNYYLTVHNLTAQSHDPVDWKSVMAQKYDVIDLSYQLTGNLKADSILFVTGTGTVYKPQGSGNKRQLYVIGGKHGDVQEIFACYRYNRDSLVNIAKLNLVSYGNVVNKITLVPLESGISLDKVQIQKALNDIYKQAVAGWEVDVAPVLNVNDSLWDLDHNGRINAGSNLFTRYSAEMKGINRYLRKQSYYNAQQYYLLVTSKPTDSLQSGLLGEMPRGSNIGYLFTAAPTATLVAHEVGHGAYALEHSFEGNATLPKGSSACLMDYNNGTELYKGKYWDYVHNPVTVIGALEDDGDGASKSDVLTFLNKIKLAYAMDSTMLVAEKSLFSSQDVYLGGLSYRFIQISINGNPKIPKNIKIKNNIKGKVDTEWSQTFGNGPIARIEIDDGLINIFAPYDRLTLLTRYITGQLEGKNLLIFVNGYRPNTPNPIENPKPPDEITFTDINAYWSGIDAMFINRIGTRNVVYADGHHSVATSNHFSENAFLRNLSEWQCVSNITATLYASLVGPATQITCAGMYHSPNFKLNRTPNVQGFIERRNNGKKAGYDLLLKLKSGVIDFDPSKDTIDIVSHSMGYAYALGIVDAIKSSDAKYKFGRFYSIAPENAKSGGVSWTDFEEVWQYGSQDNVRKEWEQDGVAPQAQMAGLDQIPGRIKHGRVYFPDNNDPKDFLECHYINNYFWIFNIKYDKNILNGYVKPRK